MDNKKYSVSELNAEIRNCLIAEFNKTINIVGEIANYKNSNGNAYFVIKDDESSINCTIWKNNNNNLKNGLNVTAIGKITTYLKMGTYQLNTYKVVINGVGDIQEKYEKLKLELGEKGYFDAKSKKELPKYINNIGIITAETGAALQDILYVLKSKNFNGNVHIRNCIVQGAQCPDSVCAGIAYFVNNKIDIDVLLVTRGGGAIEDLMGFSDESVVKAFYECNICTISAIGHEIDYMLSDYAADVRAPTPSIAADIIVGQQVKLDNMFALLIQKNNVMFENKLIDFKKKIENIKHNLNMLQKKEICKIQTEIKQKVFTKFNNEKMLFHKLKDNINSKSYLVNDKGQIMNSVKFFTDNILENLTLKLIDGEIHIKKLII